MTFAQFYYDPVTEFDRLFEDALAPRSFCPHARVSFKDGRKSQHGDAYRPRLDLVESEDGDTVTATFELPGLTSGDVAVEIKQDTLTVSSTSPDVDAEEGGTYVVRERRAGKFARRLQLPLGTKPEGVKAKMENGVLTVTFPKTAPEQQATRIVLQ